MLVRIYCTSFWLEIFFARFGGHPKLYDGKSIPCYPMLIPGLVLKLWLELRRASKKNHQTFIDVRISFYWEEVFTLHILRYIGQVETRAMPGAKPQSDKYQTLAQFYANISSLWPRMLSIKHWYTWTRNTLIYSIRIQPTINLLPVLDINDRSDADGSIIVTDLETAVEALDVPAIVAKQDYVSFFPPFY